MSKKSNTKNNHKAQKKRQGVFGASITNLLLLLLGLLVVFTFFCWQALLTPLSFTQKKQVLSVKSGQTYYGLIDDWAAQDKIKYPDLAKLYVKYFVSKPLLAGAYEIPAQASLATVLNRVARGEQAQMVRISIIEGKTYKDLLVNIRNAKYVEHTLSTLNNGDVGEHNLMALVGLPEGHPEGWFAPNTYYFSHSSSDVAILKHLYEAQSKILNDEWAKRTPNLPYANPYEALIMASIIEKETGLPDERAQVAAVFVNRLRQGMRLQTDPTVIYGMGDAYDGDIRKKDLLEKTPYNTYQIDGLPPTPIALPSQASIHAALHPADTKALFFVATGDGGHVFTNTYAEHERAVADYLKTMRQKRDSERATQDNAAGDPTNNAAADKNQSPTATDGQQGAASQQNQQNDGQITNPMPNTNTNTNTNLNAGSNSSENGTSQTPAAQPNKTYNQAHNQPHNQAQTPSAAQNGDGTQNTPTQSSKEPAKSTIKDLAKNPKQQPEQPNDTNSNTANPRLYQL